MEATEGIHTRMMIVTLMTEIGTVVVLLVVAEAVTGSIMTATVGGLMVSEGGAAEMGVETRGESEMAGGEGGEGEGEGVLMDHRPGDEVDGVGLRRSGVEFERDVLDI